MWTLLSVVLAIAAPWLVRRGWRRLELSRAKHPSIAGHARLARRFAALLPYYGYDEHQFFACDGPPAEVIARRRGGFERLAAELGSCAPASIKFSDSLAEGLSDAQFTDAYRVPFQFRGHLRDRLRFGSVFEESRGVELRDLDRRWSYDVSGSYGVNPFGYAL